MYFSVCGLLCVFFVGGGGVKHFLIVTPIQKNLLHNSLCVASHEQQEKAIFNLLSLHVLYEPDMDAPLKAS